MAKNVVKIPLFLSLAILLAAALFFLLSLESRDRKLEDLGSRLRKLEELVTVRQVYRNVIYTEIRENILVDKRSLFSIDYIITAGVDFSSGISVKAEKGSFVVKCPSPEILSIDADENSINEYFSKERFGKLRQSDYLTLVYNEKERIREEALSGGILDRAEKNLYTFITAILQSDGLGDIQLRLESREETSEDL